MAVRTLRQDVAIGVRLAAGHGVAAEDGFLHETFRRNDLYLSSCECGVVHYSTDTAEMITMGAKVILGRSSASCRGPKPASGHVPQPDLTNNVMDQKRTSGPRRRDSALAHTFRVVELVRAGRLQSF